MFKHHPGLTRLLGICVVGAALLGACGGGSDGASGGGSSSLVGRPAPDFTLPSAGGGDVSLSDYRGRKAVLLYFSMGPG